MCVYQAASRRKQLSLHKNQLEIMDARVKVLHTIDPDGTQYTIDYDGHQVSLIFSGGTDDPAIELQMKIGEVPKNPMIQNNKPFPPHVTMVLKYPALRAERSYTKYKRDVVPFHPDRKVNFTAPPPAGPHCFSKAEGEVTGCMGRDRMRWDRAEWVQQLSLQFMLDRSSARETMEKYTHSLLSGDDVRTYFMKKISLLEDSHITDEEEMTENIWKGLDPILMTLVDLPHGRDCPEVFRMHLYDKEFAEKKLVETSRSRSPMTNLFGKYGKTQGSDQGGISGGARFRKAVPTKDETKQTFG
jgi:hypothetical protein